jgi:hypothetical protein
MPVATKSTIFQNVTLCITVEIVKVEIEEEGELFPSYKASYPRR